MSFQRPLRAARIGLGSNLGDRLQAMRAAAAALAALGEGLRLSSIWASDPDRAEGGEFLNGAAELQSDRSPRELLEKLLEIERALGRQRGSAPSTGLSAARTIDLDLLHVAGELATGPELTLPHPRLFERAYVLGPLAEIAPELRDPRSGRSVAEALAACPREKRPRIIADRFHGSESSQ